MAWDESEDAILSAHYPEHGHLWIGWERWLPDRTAEEIRQRADEIAYAAPPRQSHRENLVMARMSDGKSPQEIDDEMGWEPGTARKAVVGIWKRGG